jgi:hypothetical protein
MDESHHIGMGLPAEHVCLLASVHDVAFGNLTSGTGCVMKVCSAVIQPANMVGSASGAGISM